MTDEKRGVLRSKWFYIAILGLVLVGSAFFGGMWLAGRDARSVAAVVASYAAVYAGSDSTKDVPALMLLYSEDAVLRDLADGRTYQGTAEIKTALDTLLATPEFDLTVERTLIGKDWALVTWTANGKKAETERLAQVRGATLLELSKGTITRETWYYDPANAPF